MVVNEIEVKVYLLKEVNKIEVSQELEKFIVQTLQKNPEMLKIHTELKGFKPYCYGWLTPIEKDGIYKEGQIHTFKLRTIDPALYTFFREELQHTTTNSLKGLVTAGKQVKRGYIEKLYSLTPVIVKMPSGGYWQNDYSVKDFEEQIRSNLFKKYRDYINREVSETEAVFNSIQINSKKPMAVAYKSIHLLGDKVTLGIENNSVAQDLAYLALGLGIGTMNSSGLGFVGYKY